MLTGLRGKTRPRAQLGQRCSQALWRDRFLQCREDTANRTSPCLEAWLSLPGTGPGRLHGAGAELAVAAGQQLQAGAVRPGPAEGRREETAVRQVALVAENISVNTEENISVKIFQYFPGADPEGVVVMLELLGLRLKLFQYHELKISY